MEADKRTIIVQEIELWRRNKLLPGQYCDFLLNLYRDEESEQRSKPARRAVTESHPLQWVLLFGIIGLISYVFLHFNLFPAALQIAIFLLALIGAFVWSIYLRERKPLVSAIVMGIGSFVMLVGGALWLQQHGLGDWSFLAIHLAVCAVLWGIFGISLRFPWLHLCGWVGLLLAYAVAVNRLLAPESLLVLQLCWLPGAILLG